MTRNPGQGYQSQTGRLVWPVLLGAAVAMVSGAVGWGLAIEHSELKSVILNLEKTQAREVAASQDRKTAIATVEGENLSLMLQLQSLSREHQATINEIENLQRLSSELTSEVIFDSRGQTVPLDRTIKTSDANAANNVSKADVSVLPEANPVTGELWFINFGVYPRVDAARTWSLRLREKGHSTLIHDVMTAEGESFYRLRVINLPSRAAAKILASQLEADYNLGPLSFEQDSNPL